MAMQHTALKNKLTISYFLHCAVNWPLRYLCHLVCSDEDASKKAFSRGQLAGECQNLARELMEMPANILTPTAFAERAKTLFGPGAQIIAQ